jgi:hypothetical protein
VARLRQVVYFRREQKLNLTAIKRVLGGTVEADPDSRRQKLALGQRLHELRRSRGLVLQQVGRNGGDALSQHATLLLSRLNQLGVVPLPAAAS